MSKCCNSLTQRVVPLLILNNTRSRLFNLATLSLVRNRGPSLSSSNLHLSTILRDPDEGYNPRFVVVNMGTMPHGTARFRAKSGINDIVRYINLPNSTTTVRTTYLEITLISRSLSGGFRLGRYCAEVYRLLGKRTSRSFPDMQPYDLDVLAVIGIKFTITAFIIFGLRDSKYISAETSLLIDDSHDIDDLL